MTYCDTDDKARHSFQHAFCGNQELIQIPGIPLGIPGWFRETSRSRPKSSESISLRLVLARCRSTAHIELGVVDVESGQVKRFCHQSLRWSNGRTQLERRQFLGLRLGMSWSLCFREMFKTSVAGQIISCGPVLLPNRSIWRNYTN